MPTQAHGATFNRQTTSRASRAFVAYSFYRTKNLVAWAIGVRIYCDDAAARERLIVLARRRPPRRPNRGTSFGVNSRLGRLQWLFSEGFLPH